MTQDLIVLKVDRARALLAEAGNATDAKRVADLALAAEIYARRQKLSEEAIAYATAVKVDAMTLMGEFLKEAEKNTGAADGTPGPGRGKRGAEAEPRFSAPPTLADLGISKKESSAAQALAAIKEEAPDLHEAARTGTIPVSKAAEEHRRRKGKAAAKEAREAAPPTLDLPDWEVITGDCHEELAKLAPGSVRLVFADPPYNQGVNYGEGGRADQLPEGEYLAWCQEWMDLAARVLTADGSLWVLISDEYADHFGLALRRTGLHRRQWLIWFEAFGVCDAKKRGFARSSRHLFWCVKDPDNYIFHEEAVSRPSARQTVYNDARANPDGRTWDSVWGINPDIPRLAGTHAERIGGFPTQLPLALLRPIVCCATDPGDWIVDPFNGSGTTGAVALAHGRRYLGIEKSAKYADLARMRLRSVQKEFV